MSNLLLSIGCACGGVLALVSLFAQFSNFSEDAWGYVLALGLVIFSLCAIALLWSA
jgi:hypothetical protein